MPIFVLSGMADSNPLQALQVAQHVRKGMQLAIGGHLKQSKWLDRNTGMQREALRVCSALQHSGPRCV